MKSVKTTSMFAAIALAAVPLDAAISSPNDLGVIFAKEIGASENGPVHLRIVDGTIHLEVIDVEHATLALDIGGFLTNQAYAAFINGPLDLLVAIMPADVEELARALDMIVDDTSDTFFAAFMDGIRKGIDDDIAATMAFDFDSVPLVEHGQLAGMRDMQNENYGVPTPVAPKPSWLENAAHDIGAAFKFLASLTRFGPEHANHKSAAA